MKSFHFPLERALRWRRLQEESEKTKLRRALEENAGLERQLVDCRSNKLAAAQSIVQEPGLEGRDLRALAAFETRSTLEEARLAGRLHRHQQELASQKRVYREAQQRCRVLEELRTRELTRWQYELGCEIEQTAADSHAARNGGSEDGGIF